ncbi:phosphoserine phosphatase SerB [Amphibiibacter pelophylacis]|uniref:phosphoserine phosphatase SerB n=1 Tax=Amphibiibacter pelophylacis TaxID=1799477 RepID=UPI003BFA730E
MSQHAPDPSAYDDFTPGLRVRRGLARWPLSRVRLAAFDMDSTLINIECIDEIADAAGRKAEVAAITEASMRGEITDFRESLRRRVALLRGVPESALADVLAQRLQINPGVEMFLAALHAHGVATLLVSGGFTFFSRAVRERLGMGYARANQLEVSDGVLTGGLVPQAWGDICDGAEKRRTLLELCSLLDIDPADTLAVGDGANDLPMMGAAGLSLAFHAKPLVAAQADLSLVVGPMDDVLDWFQL